MTRMLVTDLDNTLYDWVTFYATAFQAMVDSLTQLLHVDQSQLLAEFKSVHQKYRNIEQPFAALELPSVIHRFGHQSRRELMMKLDEPFHAFNRARKSTLKLYDSVQESLSSLDNSGVVIVGFTEAMPANSFYRLKQLGISERFSRLYAVEGTYAGHPIPERGSALAPPPNKVRQIPRDNRKPSPKALLDICDSESIPPEQTWYVGDSIAKDIAMAKNAGVFAVWARYGTVYDQRLWSILVGVTHWTEEDARREAEQRHLSEQVRPDYTIDSFGELLTIFEMPPPSVSTLESF